MATIDNDQDLRAALNRLNPDQQRQLGCRFAHQVMNLSRDERVKRAIHTGLMDGVSLAELEDAFRVAHAYAVKSYTDCGKDTDWMAQADHFVAAAAAAALTPDELTTERQNRAWKAAVQARMAVSCAMMENEALDESNVMREQYALTAEFLG
ncbi:hypothetical protein [Thermochromatium tepidum]|jgi:hypothetical protein|uniref:Uncharacterized protein n=1 Tax=Thermochromatium tepidum ATCC 43061 TaxID=316276 RepID=A0A6I6DVL5_THETI|nr:hypothetical protein [Thermochromatium tepidum]QGU31594.1 hypothetical protein E6P07_00450 [Thermochromatium tepidum ATCC 43061]